MRNFVKVFVVIMIFGTCATSCTKTDLTEDLYETEILGSEGDDGEVKSGPIE